MVGHNHRIKVTTVILHQTLKAIQIHEKCCVLLVILTRFTVASSGAFFLYKVHHNNLGLTTIPDKSLTTAVS